MTSTRNISKRRWVKPATVAAGTALVATLTAAPAYAWHLHSTVSGNVKHAALMPAGHQASDAKDGENILLIGAATKTKGRADGGMFVLAHVAADRSRLDLVQFPRDMEVSGNRELQSLRGNGNEQQVVKNIERVADINIDHVAKLGFDNVRDLVNTVGGVTVDGKTLSGDQALQWLNADDAYSTSADIAQGDRQMTFLKAVMAQAADSGVLTNPVKLSQYLDVATREITVDKKWDVSEMEQLALSMKGITGNEVHTWTAPTKDSAQLEKLSDALRNDAMDQYTAN